MVSLAEPVICHSVKNLSRFRGLAVVFAEDPGAIAHQDHPRELFHYFVGVEKIFETEAAEWDKLCPVAKIPINRPMSLFDTLFSYFY